MSETPALDNNIPASTAELGPFASEEQVESYIDSLPKPLFRDLLDFTRKRADAEQTARITEASSRDPFFAHLQEFLGQMSAEEIQEITRIVRFEQSILRLCKEEDAA